MKPEFITDHMDIWTSAVKAKSAVGRGSSKKIDLYGIKKLRELILELAVRGKLVPQDPSDEPASVLLERIAEEKERLVKAGGIKKPKPLSKIDNEKPFFIPHSWEWSQLGFLTNYGACDKAEHADVVSTTWVLELEDVEKNTSKLLKKVRFIDRAFKSSKNIFLKNDVIYGKLRPYLDKVLVANEDGVCTTEMIPIRSYRDLTSKFLRLVLKTPYFIKYANSSTHGMNLPRMGTDKARAALIPLAPIEEQHRIVAKVDELMALCDKLEQQTQDSIDAHQLLVETLLATLTNNQKGADFSQNWARLHTHFDILFTTERSIDALKQTILQLAVMGKLVPQDPNDEPASKLLERIAKEKAQLIKDKKIKKPKDLPPITEEEKPFDLPKGWEWARIFDVSLFSEYGSSQKTVTELPDGVPVLKMGDIQSGQLILGKHQVVSAQIEDLPNLYLKFGDVLYNRTNSAELVGKTGMYKGEDDTHTFASYLIRIRCNFNHMRPEFLTFCMNTPLFRKTQIDPHIKQQCGQANVNGTLMKSMLVSVPPINEQNRILTEIDALLPYCDQLKQRLRDSQQTQLLLTDAIVQQAL